VPAAIGALAACGAISLGLIAGGEPSPSREIDFSLDVDSFAVTVLCLVVMFGGVSWHAVSAIRQRQGSIWLEVALLAMSLASIATMLTGGANAGSPAWPGLVAGFAVAAILHVVDPSGTRLRMPSPAVFRTASSG
jgi:hypothetical protein